MKQISIRAFVLVLTLAGVASSVTARAPRANRTGASVAPAGSIIFPPCSPKTCDLD